MKEQHEKQISHEESYASYWWTAHVKADPAVQAARAELEAQREAARKMARDGS